MILSLLHSLRGYLLLRLDGAYIERFLNLCVQSGIYLWQIRKQDGGALVFVSIAGFRRMRVPARKTKTRVRILQKRGLPLVLHRYRRRRGFAIGVVLFAFILLLLSSFVWSIEIDDTVSVDKNMIRNALKTCGLDIGVLKYKIKASDIKAEMLRTVPELSWLWVEVKGTHAFVHLREKTEAPPLSSAEGPANLLAEKDGVIVSCNAVRGKAQVVPGDVVQKGALLISGTVETKHGGTLLVHSEGEVLARTWYSASAVFPMEAVFERETGRQEKRYAISVGPYRVPLYRTPPFASYQASVHSAPLSLWGDLTLPLALETESFAETVQEVRRLSGAQAEAHYGAILQKELPLPEDAQLINTSFSHTLQEDGSVLVAVTVECIEDIGETHEILEEQENDGEIF